MNMTIFGHASGVILLGSTVSAHVTKLSVTLYGSLILHHWYQIILYGLAQSFGTAIAVLTIPVPLPLTFV